MSNETQQKQGFEIHPPGWDGAQEQWNRVHAQLLKSVADAQGKLLAGINELSDTKVLIASGINALAGRLDAILAELLTVRRPVARPVKRAKRRR